PALRLVAPPGLYVCISLLGRRYLGAASQREANVGPIDNLVWISNGELSIVSRNRLEGKWFRPIFGPDSPLFLPAFPIPLSDQPATITTELYKNAKMAGEKTAPSPGSIARTSCLIDEREP